jgi:protein involved in polysaccharide export with SLBB domain
MTHQTKEVLEASPKRPPVARELAKQVLPVHYLQPGDELLVEAVNGESEIRIPADQQVAADGSLDLGKFGRLIVASLTLEQTEHLIYEAIAAAENVDVSVNVRLIQPIHRYYVVGEVNSPGAYPLTGYETVLDGIMTAGGLTSRASACDTLLARPSDPCSCRVTLPVCYRAITQLGDTTTNYQLRPGDRIFVGRQSFKEEFLPCCSKHTCERCCGQQTACCDPGVADRTMPDFSQQPANLIATTSVPAPAESANQKSEQGADNSVSPEVQIEPWPPASVTDEAQQSAPEASPTPERAREDGQLDFDFLPETGSDSDTN